MTEHSSKYTSPMSLMWGTGDVGQEVHQDNARGDRNGPVLWGSKAYLRAV